MASATGYNGLVIGRAMTGLAAAAWVPLTVLFSSQFPAADAVRATALLSVINGAARIVATGTTGTLNQSGGYALAFIVAAGAAGLAALVTLPVREVPRVPKRPSFRETGLLVSRPDVLVPALLSAVGQYVTWSTTFSFLPILARNMGANDVTQSMLVTLNLAISLAGNLLTTAIARRVGNMRLLYAAYILFIGGTVVLATAQTLIVVILAQIILGLGNGIGYPLCMGMSIEKVDDSQRTIAMGLHQAVYAIGMFAGPWLSGILADTIQIQPMFWFTAAACFVLSAVLIRKLQAKSV
jgi:MFS family permease